MDEAVGFEETLRLLEQAVTALEGGDLGLDEALARYEDGVRLLGRCKAMLDQAERRVAILNGTDADGSPVAVPFDVSATADRTRGDE
jgi:exodeoxyribonuclease VII small subunit